MASCVFNADYLGSIAYWAIHNQLSSVGINETKFADSVTLFKLDAVFKNIWVWRLFCFCIIVNSN
jgi:hypothetical protein